MESFTRRKFVQTSVLAAAGGAALTASAPTATADIIGRGLARDNTNVQICNSRAATGATYLLLAEQDAPRLNGGRIIPVQITIRYLP